MPFAFARPQELAPRRRRRALLLATLLGAAGAAWVLPAAAQSIRACYVPGSGTVYRVGAPGAPDACTAGAHVEFAWEATGVGGPSGPVGATGPTGPVGPQGPAGADGVSGYEVVSSSGTLPGGGTLTLQMDCPAGKAVLGGGFTYSFANTLALKASYPTASGGVSSWVVVLQNSILTDVPVSAYATCALAR